ncbi:MAG: glycosyltransferase family 9 protein [Selenomonadaceae bacterium]|nr:glycosyltransferase family 9 protein [Selenomonadaceae bacterium]
MKNILIVKLSAIGDVIHALPVSYAIKETFPDSHITWVAEAAAYELLLANPCVDELILFKKQEFKSFQGLTKNFLPFRRVLRQRRYETSLDLQGLFKSAAIVAVAGAKRKLGTCNMREFSNKVSLPVIGSHANGHIVERYLDVARAMGCRVEKVVFPLAIPEEDARGAQGILAHGGVPTGRTYAVLAVGANWPNKRWPVDYYAKLSDYLYERQIIPVIVGSGAVDAQLAADIENLTEVPPINLVGRTGLRQLAYVLQQARLVIGGDTGAVHLAAGLRVNTIMLMGPTDAKRNGPYGQLQSAIEIERTCRYCWKRACPLGKDCLAAITPEMVKQKLNFL